MAVCVGSGIGANRDHGQSQVVSFDKKFRVLQVYHVLFPSITSMSFSCAMMSKPPPLVFAIGCDLTRLTGGLEERVSLLVGRRFNGDKNVRVESG